MPRSNFNVLSSLFASDKSLVTCPTAATLARCRECFIMLLQFMPLELDIIRVIIYFFDFAEVIRWCWLWCDAARGYDVLAMEMSFSPRDSRRDDDTPIHTIDISPKCVYIFCHFILLRFTTACHVITGNETFTHRKYKYFSFRWDDDDVIFECFYILMSILYTVTYDRMKMIRFLVLWRINYYACFAETIFRAMRCTRSAPVTHYKFPPPYTG